MPKISAKLSMFAYNTNLYRSWLGRSYCSKFKLARDVTAFLTNLGKRRESLPDFGGSTLLALATHLTKFATPFLRRDILPASLQSPKSLNMKLITNKMF